MNENRDPEKIVREIKRKTRRKFNAEEKIRIVLEGLKGEVSIVELCRREGIVSNLYYRWSKEFLEAGKKRLSGDTAREATSSEVGDHLIDKLVCIVELLGHAYPPLIQYTSWPLTQKYLHSLLCLQYSKSFRGLQRSFVG